MRASILHCVLSSVHCRVLLVSAAALASGCGDNKAASPTPDMAAAAVLPDDPNPNPICQPINAVGNAVANGAGSGECFLPFPSAFYETADSTTASKYRVSLPVGVMPKNQVGKDFDPRRFNLLDGWSPSAMLVANLKAYLDPAQLPRSELSGGKIEETLKAESRFQLLEYDTGERVGVWAELDANVKFDCQAATDCRPTETCMASRCEVQCQSDSDCKSGTTCGSGICGPYPDQVVIVHPIVRLKPATRYVVAMQNLVDRDGKAIVVKPFRQLADGKVPAGSALEKVGARYQEIFALLDKQKVPRAGLTFAWDFVTASDEQATRNVLSMRDAAFKRWEKDNLGWTVDCDSRTTPQTDACKGLVNTDPNETDLWFNLYGHFQVPSFLQSATDPNAQLNLDSKGVVSDSGSNYDAILRINVPMCARDAAMKGKKVPFLIYGHGLLGSSGEIDAGYNKHTANYLCMIYLGTEWVGLAEDDVNQIVANVFSNWDHISLPTDRLQQAQVNFMTLARMATRKLKNMTQLQVAGVPFVDGNEVYYYGNSQGGIEGNILMALSPELTHGVLGVGAGDYSYLITRSADFAQFKGILDNTYPSRRDQAILIAISQSFWDFADPIAYAAHTIKAPFNDDTGKPMLPKHVIEAESRFDGQVPNEGLHMLVRQLGISKLDPSNYPVYGVPSAVGPLDSAYVQYDDSPRWKGTSRFFPADVNIPSAHDNPAHEAVRRMPAFIDQMKSFLRPDGKVLNFCDGPCDSSGPAEWPNGQQ